MRFTLTRSPIRPAGVSRWKHVLPAVALIAALPSTGSVHASALATDPFVLVPEFGGGALMADTFTAHLAGNEGSIGRRVEFAHKAQHATFSLVKNVSGNQASALWNIGIVQYDAFTGEAVPWWNPSPEYGLPGDIHVVYPRADSARFTQLAATRRLFNDYYVLTDHATPGASDWRQGMLLKFSTVGRYIGRATTSPQLHDTRMSDLVVVGDQPAGHPVFVDGYGLMAVGTRLVDDRGSVMLTQINPSGSGGLPFAGTPIPISTTYCDATTDCRAETMLGRRESIDGGGERYVLYIAARTRTPGSANWRTLMIKTDTEGNVLASRRVDLGSGGAERPVQIIDTIASMIVITEVARNCYDGFALATFPFSLSGTVSWTTVGGYHSDESPPVCPTTGDAHFPRAARIGAGPNGSGRLMIVGRSDRVTESGPTRLRGFVASFSHSSDFRGMSYFDSPDLYGHPTNAVFNHLRQSWGGPTENWAEVVGDIRILDHDSVPVSLRNKVTSMRAAIRSERIFGDGFRRCRDVPGC